MKKFFLRVLLVIIFLLMLPALIILATGAAIKDDEFDATVKSVMLGLACINSAAIWWVILN